LLDELPRVGDAHFKLTPEDLKGLVLVFFIDLVTDYAEYIVVEGGFQGVQVLVTQGGGWLTGERGILKLGLRGHQQRAVFLHYRGIHHPHLLGSC